MKFYTVTLQHIHYCHYGYSVIGRLNDTEIYDIYKIYRLSDDEREWIEMGEIIDRLVYFGVASLNGKIYITGGEMLLILYDK